MVHKIKAFTVNNIENIKRKIGGGKDNACVRPGNKRHTRRRSKWTAAKTLLSLIPRQVSDEIELAKKELKIRGKIIGSSTIFFAVALAAALLLPIAVTVLIISLLAIVLPLWLAAIVFIVVFLALAVIFVLAGLQKFKKAFPVVPKLSLRGIALDCGIIKEGSNFSEEEYDQRQEQKRAVREQKKNDQKNSEHYAASSGSSLSCEELVARLTSRRDHIRALRDQLCGKKRHQAVMQQCTSEMPAANFSVDCKPRDDPYNLLGQGVASPPEYEEKEGCVPCAPAGGENKNKKEHVLKGKVPLTIFLASGLLSVLTFSLIAIEKNRRK